MRRSLLLLCFIVISTCCFSQQVDSAITVIDSLESVRDEIISEEEEKDSKGLPDSTQVSIRKVDEETIRKLNSDAELKYKEPPTVGESLWMRFWAWIGQIIESFFDNTIETSWGRILMYIGGAVLIIVLVLVVLKVNAFNLFYAKKGTGSFGHDTLHENIHEMNFDNLIQGAVDKNDYRLAVRLVFLYALKMLADRNYIRWDQGKTNEDYLREMNKEDLKAGLHELNYFFEYAWYGNFRINAEMFSQIQTSFNNWKEKVR